MFINKAHEVIYNEVCKYDMFDKIKIYLHYKLTYIKLIHVDSLHFRYLNFEDFCKINIVDIGPLWKEQCFANRYSVKCELFNHIKKYDNIKEIITKIK